MISTKIKSSSTMKCALLIVMLCATVSLSRASDSPKKAEPRSNTEAMVCFSAREAGDIATSQVEALKAIKSLKSQLELERAKGPGRFGWSIGAGIGVGYDFEHTQANVEPFVGIMWGIRF